jgi:hypothetical protein
MHEFSWASIRIGGQILKDHIKDLINLLEDANLLTDELGHSLDNPTIDDIMTRFKSDNDTLLFKYDKADSGEYKALEQWLQKHNLSFIRMSYSGTDNGEYIPSRTVFWTPFIFDGFPKVIIDDTERGHMVHVGEIKWILSAIETVGGSIIEAPKFLNHGNAHEQAYAAYVLDRGEADPVGYLKKHIKDHYTEPKLPPFEII